MATNPYELLKQPDIIQILVGDKIFGAVPCGYEYDAFWDAKISYKVNISLPYLSIRDICDISIRLGFPMQCDEECLIYDEILNLRHEYFEKMLDYFIKANRCPDLLAFLFGKSQFQSKLSDLPREKIEAYYNHIVKTVLGKINSILHFSGHEMKIIGQKFVVQPSGTKLEVHAPTIEKTIDRPYIADLTARALQDIDAGHFDSALTKSKTLLEEVFKYVIEQKCGTHPKNDTITKLNKHFIDLYYMEMDTKNKQNTDELLHGLAKIIAAISELRNRNSDAHGHGSERTNDIKDHHARLVVNASMTLAEFILSVAQNNSYSYKDKIICD